MNASRYALLLSILAVLLLLVAGPGTRLEWWDFRTGFGLMRWAAYAGLVAAAVALVMLLVPRIRRSGIAAMLAALVIGVGVALVPLNGMRQAKKVPPIHDISTDTRRPPGFVAILPLRADAPNPAAYGGADVARAQAEAYPDLQTRRMELAPARAFERALATARNMDWEIVVADPASGRIEATATTLWFGFKDDVVIRVEPDDAGSRVDVRSVSRVGKSDVGTNARRIRAYLEMLGN
ncbi:MAG: DUF1499 domain-containing protein [Lysobacter sp.]